jgi:hypothetical protein
MGNVKFGEEGSCGIFEKEEMLKSEKLRFGFL